LLHRTHGFRRKWSPAFRALETGYELTQGRTFANGSPRAQQKERRQSLMAASPASDLEMGVSATFKICDWARRLDRCVVGRFHSDVRAACSAPCRFEAPCPLVASLRIDFAGTREGGLSLDLDQKIENRF
jgi:hypothetical protein